MCAVYQASNVLCFSEILPKVSCCEPDCTTSIEQHQEPSDGGSIHSC
jgi:hypothetical protein